jgi:glycosyltransferase involved in cell wall biosynthesis
MRIAINAVAVHGGGSLTYLLNILKALCAISGDHHLMVILSPRQASLLVSIPRRIQGVLCRGVPRQAGLRMIWEQTILPVLLWRWNVDVLYAAFDTAVLLSPVPVVLLSHNCDPFVSTRLSRSVYGRARNLILRFLGILSARKARTVVFVSNSSAKMLSHKMRIPESKTRVVYHGWSPTQGTETDGCRLPEDLPRRYLLSVADLYPHKNLEVLLEAFQLLTAKGSYSGDLVLVGARRKNAWGYGQRLLALRETLSCRDRIHFVGSIPHPQLFAVYRKADLFLFSSLSETFALPLVEAMASRVPLVVADWRMAPGGETDRINVGPEICADAAEYFNPLDPCSLAVAIDRVLTDPQKQKELAGRGWDRVQDFTWQRSATALLRIFEESVTRCGVWS